MKKAWATTTSLFSSDRVYRYMLERVFDPADSSRLVVIGLNPSTADEVDDDPTVRRCLGFAEREGKGGLIMLNIFAFRTTDPKQMKEHRRSVGEENNAILAAYCEHYNHQVVAAWGNHGSHMGRCGFVAGSLKHITPLWCWGRNKTGEPKHPLYLRSDTPLELFL